MAKTVQIRARTDPKTKRRAEEILEELGVSPSTAINMFYRQIVMRGALPFPVEVPNAATKAAIDETRSGEGLLEGEDLPKLLSKLLTKRERTFDVAELFDADPDLLKLAERVLKAAG